MHIVLDANIIIAEGFGSSGDFRLLLSNLDILQHNLYVPRLVIEEVVSGFERAYDNHRKRVANDISWLSRHLDVDLPSPMAALNRRIDAGLFRNQLIERFDIPNCSIVGYPDTPHEDLVIRATTRRKPFNQNGVGYRDSLIWETTLLLATASESQFVLLSENTKDFGDADGKLHPDLIQDLVVRELPSDMVVLVSSLEDFIDTYIDPSLSKGNLE